MEELTFYATIRQTNDVAVVTVPMRYVRDGYAKIGEQVKVTLRRRKK